MKHTNDIFLDRGNGLPNHFRLKGFANGDGLVMVHPRLVECLEQLRARLCDLFREEVWVIITDGIRTKQDNERLAAKLGWTNQGGAVSPDSKHLTKYGGIAADIKCFKAQKNAQGFRERIAQAIVGHQARKIFAYVKDDYGDGHVHVDCWDRKRGRVA